MARKPKPKVDAPAKPVKPLPPPKPTKQPGSVKALAAVAGLDVNAYVQLVYRE